MCKALHLITNIEEKEEGRKEWREGRREWRGVRKDGKEGRKGEGGMEAKGKGKTEHFHHPENV
jgi:hypothetical protein